MKTPQPFKESPNTSNSFKSSEPIPTCIWGLIPQGRDIRELLSAAQSLPGRNINVFDLTAPVLGRLSRVQADGGPTAEVTRLTSDPGGFYIKVRCPFCGADHRHGGGSLVLPNFGHRVADCGRGSYFLMVEVRS